MKFGRLEVLGDAVPAIVPSGQIKRRLFCLCQCGNVVAVSASNLRSETTISCGCYRVEVSTRESTKHGGTGSLAYGVWAGMKKRCLNPNEPAYKNYGGRGIKVCERWLGDDGFPNFFKDMGKRPKGCSLDRIDNDGPYSPENCRWSNRFDQANNKRNNVYLVVSGVRKTISQWSRDIGISPTLVSGRIKRGWAPERALMTPPREMDRAFV